MSLKWFLGLSLGLAAVSSSVVVAQQVAPWRRPGDLLVTDPSSDNVYRFADFNLDGDYDDAGEVVVFFTSGTGGFAMPLMASVAVGPDGAAFVCCTTSDIVLRLVDQNGDLDANDPGEQTVWFGSTGSAYPNASGLNVPAMLGVAVTPLGEVLATNSGSSAAPTDGVLKFVDLNADGDAQDAGEAFYYATTSTSSAGGNSVPASVAFGYDGLVYYTESGATVGSSAGLTRGVWQLNDLNLDGDCDDAGEKNVFWNIAPSFVSGTTAATYGLAFDDDGRVFVSDHLEDKIWVLQDLNADQTITNGGAEETVYFTPGATSLMWCLAIGRDPYFGRRVFITEDQAPDRVRAFTDLNGDDDAYDLGEAGNAYDPAVASLAISGARGCAFMKGPAVVASPIPAVLGQNITVNCTAAANDLFAVELGLPVAFPFQIAPLGTLYLDPTPGTYFDLIPLFVMPPNGEFGVTFPVPNFPPLLGATLMLQGLGGPPTRIVLTNPVTVTFI
jgi:hypothetical protein